MEENTCIIILSYPNTDEKLKNLNKSIESVKELNIPIFLFSNMDIDEKYLNGVEKFIYTGENKMVSAADYLSKEEITRARYKTKYRFHLKNNENIISYLPINYGTEKNYYWALIKLYRVAFEYCFKEGYTHFMLLQELILKDEDILLTKTYINEVIDNKLDGLISVDPNMGENHFSDFVFFGKTKWWNEMFKTTNVEEFYKMTFPNWVVEQYFYKKCKQKEGNIKFKITTQIEQWQEKYYKIFPKTWIREDINVISNEPHRLFYPNLKIEDLSNSWETPYFDIEKSLVVSVLPFDDGYQIFVWNRPISNKDKIIKVKITLLNSENYSEVINKEFLPGGWHLININENLYGKEVEVFYSYIDNEEIITDTKIYFL